MVVRTCLHLIVTVAHWVFGCVNASTVLRGNGLQWFWESQCGVVGTVSEESPGDRLEFPLCHEGLLCGLRPGTRFSLALPPRRRPTRISRIKALTFHPETVPGLWRAAGIQSDCSRRTVALEWALPSFGPGVLWLTWAAEVRSLKAVGCPLDNFVVASVPAGTSSSNDILFWGHNYCFLGKISSPAATERTESFLVLKLCWVRLLKTYTL